MKEIRFFAICDICNFESEPTSDVKEITLLPTGWRQTRRGFGYITICPTCNQLGRKNRKDYQK